MKRRFKAVSLRLDFAIYQWLRQQAFAQEASINTVVNQQLAALAQVIWDNKKKRIPLSARLIAALERDHGRASRTKILQRLHVMSSDLSAAQEAVGVEQVKAIDNGSIWLQSQEILDRHGGIEAWRAWRRTQI